MRGVVWALGIMAAVSAAALALVAFGGRSAANRMRADLALHVDQGGIVDLDRALALGRRLVVADETDAEAAAAVAFVDAVLAVDYGLDTAREARTVLRRWDHKDASPTEARPVVAAARALLLLRAGDREGAAHLAASAVAAFPGTPHPLYALGRIRVLNGDTVGGARALKAAIVGSPGFMLARVAWAEAHLDLGDAALGRLALQEVLARTPGDLRARLLLDEAEQAIGVEDPVTLSAACPPVQGRWPPASIKAGCALVRATAARRSGARAEALVGAEDAAGAAPAEARLLARVAQALAQLGALDRAAELLERARRFAAPETPALAWAGVAVALGRGRAASLPGGPPPADPEIRLLRARAALAAGGVGALVAELDGLGAEALKRDVDLRLLARLGGEAPVIPEAIGGGDPVHAYVDGLRARLAGNLPAAAASLRNALSGHGDACRAAGEYVVILRVLKLGIDPAAWRLLRAENASCVNLR